MARDERLVIRLTTEALDRVRNHSVKRGVTMSALGAWVLGEWLYTQERIEPAISFISKGILSTVEKSK